MASGLTTNFLIPYPLSTDPVDVAGDIEDLADRLESVITTIAPPQLNNSGKFLTTNGSVASWADPFPSQSSNSGKYLTTNGSSLSWASVDAFPSQSGNTGKYLTTNGSSVSWATVDALPSQSSNSGKYLTTDGTSASWATIPVTAAATPTVAGTVFGYTTGTSPLNSNIALGYEALNTSLVALRSNIAIGYATLYSATTGNANIAIGRQSLYSTTTGFYNISIGADTMYSNTTGENNTVVGTFSLGSNVTGNNNSVFGQGALGRVNSPQRTVAIGNETIDGFTSTPDSVIDSVAVGYRAMWTTKFSDGTVAIGSSALINAGQTTTTAANTAVGAGAGSLITTGISNVILGAYANSITTTGSNTIVIGQGANPTSATASNEITLGNASITRFRVPGLNIDWQNGPYTLSRNVQTVSYTIALSDSGKLIEMNLSSANTLAIPLNSTADFAIGTQINILQTGTGQTTIAGVVGVTVNGNPGLKLAGQWAAATIIKRDTNTWVAIGNLTT